MSDSRASLVFRIVAALLGVGVTLFFWPGVAMYDSVAQYMQVVTGHYYDWHPPVMARLWSLFSAAGWRGQAPMFLLQTLLYWLGLGLLAAALARQGARIAASAVLVLGLWPPFLGWNAAVLKDVQMATAMLAATGLVAWERLDGRPLGIPVAVAVLVLLVYAMLVRVNAVFAAAPLAVGLFAPWRWDRWISRFALVGAVAIAVLAISPVVNHGLFGARQTGVETTQPIFDMAGIAHRAGPDSVPLIPPAMWHKLEAERCHSSVLWDIFSAGMRCDAIQKNLEGKPNAAVFAGWTRAIREHPVAYAEHRISHWNATMRWFVPWHFPQAVPQAESEPNDLGLGSPPARVAVFDGIAGWFANSPLGSPILALAVALAVLALARPAQSAAHALAVPLALSAAAMEFSFLVISIAGDWRYHLWSMIAAWLSAILLLTRPVSRRAAGIALAGVLLVAVTGLAARLALPQVGDDYDALVR